MQKEKLSFRVHSDLAGWLRAQPNISRTVNEALKRYHGRTDWRESDNAQLSQLVTEITRIGTNINQIARVLNIGNRSGDLAHQVDDMQRAGRELRALQGEIGTLLRSWNG